MAFLDENGLSHLIEKIKTYIKNATVAKAGTADKLATTTKFYIGGAATGNGVSYNGTSPVTIPISGLNNTAIKWGTTGDTKSQVTPMGTALVSEFNANRIAFLDPRFITSEYSTDGGATWTEETSVSKKNSLTVGFSANFYVGNKQNDSATLDDMYRITISNRPLEDGTNPHLYCNIRKIFIAVSTGGAADCKVKIEKSTIGAPDTWVELKTTDIGGWSGWNDINIPNTSFGGSDNQTAQAAKLRFTFSIGSLNSNTAYKNNLMINGLWFCGENCFSSPSMLARTGHLYTINADSKRAHFPGGINVEDYIVGNLSGYASYAHRDGVGNLINQTYLKKTDYLVETLVLNGGNASDTESKRYV